MAAGLGFKTFTTGEVLTAADTNGYLMQGILVFADAAARDAAITSPQEGQACYLKDTDQVLSYSGSTWVAVGGGSPLTTKGDLYTFSTVDARLGVGANGTTLVADSSEATGLKWALPSASGFVGVLLFKTANQSFASGSGTNVTFNSELFDTDSFHSTATNTDRITIPAGKNGYYLLTFKGIWDASSTGQRIATIRKNSGSTVIGRYVINNQTSGVDTTVFVQTIANLVATDFVVAECYQDGTGSLDIQGGDERHTFFSAQYLGA